MSDSLHYIKNITWFQSFALFLIIEYIKPCLTFNILWTISLTLSLIRQFCSRRLWKYFDNKWKISIIEWITYDEKWKTLCQKEKLLVFSVYMRERVNMQLCMLKIGYTFLIHSWNHTKGRNCIMSNFSYLFLNKFGQGHR